MKVLVCQFGGYGEWEIENAFVKLGYQVERFNAKADNHDYDKRLLNEFTERMQKVKVDFVFSYNFLPLISKICNIFKTIYISWVFDFPEMHLYSAAIKNPINRIFLFDRIQYNRFVHKNPEHIFYMPLATKPMTRLEQDNISEEAWHSYTCDISFVGSLYNESDRHYNTFSLSQLPDYWRGYIQGIIEAQVNVFGYNFIADSLSDSDVATLSKLLKYEMIDDYERIDREVLADVYIGTMASALDRQRTIQRLSQTHRITLYTYSDTSNFENVENRGVVDPITVAPKVFHCSKINLNITAKTIQSGVPLRVFDVLGAGGFLITNYQTELYDLFEPGVDLVVYEDLKDLEEKVSYYLQHEEERKQIAINGYNRICSYYTYEIALKKILTLAGVV